MMSAPPTSWIGVSVNPNSRKASAIVQIGSTVLMIEACAAPMRWAPRVERLDRDERRHDADADEPGQASARDLAGEDRVEPSRAPDPVDRGRRGHHQRRRRGRRRAAVGLVADGPASLAGQPRREHDPDRVDEDRRDDEDQPGYRRRVVGSMPPIVSATPTSAIPSAAHARRPSSRWPTRSVTHGHHRRIREDDQAGQCRRDGLERGVVRAGVADVQDAEAEADEDRAPVEVAQARAAGWTTRAARPRPGSPRTGTATTTARASPRRRRRPAGRRAIRSRIRRPRPG